MCRKSTLRHLKQSRLIFNLLIPKASRRNLEEIARQSPLLTPMSVPKTTPVFHQVPQIMHKCNPFTSHKFSKNPEIHRSQYFQKPFVP